MFFTVVATESNSKIQQCKTEARKIALGNEVPNFNCEVK